MSNLQDIINTHPNLRWGTRVRINGNAKKVKRGEVPENATGRITGYNDIGVTLDDGRLVRVTPVSIDVL